jgi:membrane-associated protein
MDVLRTIIEYFIEFVLHMDKQLPLIVDKIGIWTYLALFLVIFVETGIVIFPFLPGDSLLFAAGAISALKLPSGMPVLNPFVLYILLASAAILGDTVNYWIGHYLGPKVFTTNSRWLKREYLDRTQAFYDKYGGKTIFLARFVPIVRTFAPFVAGVGKMRYSYFLSYNILGGLVWTGLFVAAGYFFGNLPIVRDNFSLVIIVIILISVIPVVYEFIKARSSRPSSVEQG